jgi:hypothetical protein
MWLTEEGNLPQYYVGNWRENMLDGEGLLSYSDGSQEKGTWLNDQK